MLTFFFFFFSLFLLCFVRNLGWLMVYVYMGLCFFYGIKYMYVPMLSGVMVSYLFSYDMMSLVLFMLSIWVSCMMFMASYKINMEGNSVSFFMFVVLFLTLVLMFTFSVHNMVFFYMLFEVSLIPTLMLVMGWGYQPERLQAGMYLMMYTISASLPLLFSLMYISYYSGSLYMGFFVNLDFSQSSVIYLWWFISLMAFMVKMPMYLTHLWLPKAHVEAPVAGSMVLAGILLKLGSYGLLRMSSLMIWANMYVLSFFVGVSMWGACMTSMICMRQMDLKSLIAYSSVGHMGLVICGIMSNTCWGWWGSLVMMVAHGLVSSALFAIANMTYENTSTRSIYLTRGLLSILPIMSMFWFILGVMNMGAPPSINLYGEIMLLTSILNISLSLGLLVGLSSFLAAVYSLYLYTSTQHGQVSLYINVMNPGGVRNISVLFFHIVPALFFILFPQFITLWV